MYFLKWQADSKNSLSYCTSSGHRRCLRSYGKLEYNKNIGPIHTKFSMDVRLGKRISYADFGGGIFKVKVMRALCY